MTTFLLIRHADCDPVGKSIAGRAAGVHLNEAGRAQARSVAQLLADVRIDSVYSSPVDRALETAEPIAAASGLTVQELDAITELDFGEWTGAALGELDGDPQWHRFNSLRSVTRIPGGESMLEVQARSVSALADLSLAHADSCIALVTHGDIIRSLIAHYCGIPLDLFQRIEVSPASVSVVALTPDWVTVKCVNSTVHLPT